MQPDVAELPPTAQAVAEVIGRELTLKLAREVRFRSLYIPFQLDEKHWISRCIGYPAARKLQVEFVGMSLPLAKCREVALVERNNRIRGVHSRGVSAVDIAYLLGISERTVHRVVRTYGKTSHISGHAEQTRRTEGARPGGGGGLSDASLGRQSL